MRKDGVNIIVTGAAGTGKSTIAVLIQRYLQTLGFNGVTVELTDNEMPRCPSELRKSTASLIDADTKITVTEKMTRHDGRHKDGLPPPETT